MQGLLAVNTSEGADTALTGGEIADCLQQLYDEGRRSAGRMWHLPRAGPDDWFQCSASAHRLAAEEAGWIWGNGAPDA